MFQLTEIEYKNLKPQIGTTSLNNYGGVRKLPYAFTEQGVAMLATVLRTQVADIISMKIIDAFVYIKKYTSQYNNIVFINDNPFHDRYIILDRRDVFVSEMSLKDIGKKYSYINKVNEEIFMNELIKRINDVL